MLNAYLENDYELLFAETGAEALETIRAHSETLSLVLLDLILPDINGLDILRRIKQDADLTRIPIIVLTSDTESEVESLNTGASDFISSDFISKPYPRHEVIMARTRRSIELSENRDLIRWTERDHLTGLFNRDYFYRYAEQYDLFHAEEPTDALVLDISHFHMINERFGKAYGDEILRRIGAELLRMARLYGGIVCRREADDTVNADMLGHIRLRVGVYAEVDKRLEMERRFDHAKDAADSIRNSYSASVAVYDDRLHEQEVFAERLLDDFHSALEQKQFIVFFQPKFDASGAGHGQPRRVHPAA